jgi:hypothetical protein
LNKKFKMSAGIRKNIIDNWVEFPSFGGVRGGYSS